MTLFINACVRKESRTRRLAEVLLGKLGGPVTELDLSEIDFPVTDEVFLAQREQAAAGTEMTCDVPEQVTDMLQLARQFAEADQIVIAAPFWDLSFPAALKQYFEQINVVGITFVYTPEGFPQGLCKARSLYYVTTAGGDFFPEEFGFGYVRALGQGFYGIPKVELIAATGLDIVGADVEGILRKCEEEMSQ